MLSFLKFIGARLPPTPKLGGEGGRKFKRRLSLKCVGGTRFSWTTDVSARYFFQGKMEAPRVCETVSLWRNTNSVSYFKALYEGLATADSALVIFEANAAVLPRKSCLSWKVNRLKKGRRKGGGWPGPADGVASGEGPKIAIFLVASLGPSPPRFWTISSVTLSRSWPEKVTPPPKQPKNYD